jgi:hypothetical protein
MNRRNVLKAATATAGLSMLSPLAIAEKPKKNSEKFRLSLNTSTIMGQKLGVEKYIEIGAVRGTIASSYGSEISKSI